MRLSSRVATLPASGIRAMFDLAQQYPDRINLGIGDPGFATPQHIIDACSRALNSGFTKYLPNVGYQPLREAIAEKMNRQNGFSVTADNVIVNFGAGQALMSTLQAILNPGDEILVLNPCYASYYGYVALSGAITVPVPLKEEHQFQARAEVLREYVTDRTRAIFLNTPSNPTGSVTPKKELEKIAALAEEHDLLIVSDEPYENLVYDGNEHFSIATLPGMFDRVVTVNSFSKTYAMTGWRIGYTVAPVKVIRAMTLLQEALSANVTSAVQVAAIEALKGPQDCVAEMVAGYDRCRKLLVNGLNRLKGFSCPMPAGAFYAFANIQGTGMTSEDLAMKLLKEVHVVTTPGDAFGPAGKGYLRFTFASSYEDIERALERLEKCVGRK